MSFLYTTPAGAIDAAVLAAVCGLVLWTGKPGARVIAGVMLAVYLADRAFLSSMPLDLLLPFSAGAELLAMAVVLALVNDRLGRSVAALCFVKMLAYAACLYSFIGFGAMAAAATIGAYLQMMLLIGLGVPWHGLGIFKGLRDHGDSRPIATRLVAVVARKSPPK